MSGTEKIILSHLVHSETYMRKVIPFLKEEYFSSSGDEVVFGIIKSHVEKYTRAPSKKELFVELENKQYHEKLFEAAKETIDRLDKNIIENEQWLLETTEKYCQEQAVHNAILKAIEIQEDKGGKLSKGSIPQILSDALAVSFDSSVGHDYLDDAEFRYQVLHEKHKRVRFHLSYLNKITKGGLIGKTLNLLILPTGGGKSLIMCDFAANNLEDGLNVLYITLEMSEEKIGERIDANLCNLTFEELEKISKPEFLKRIDKIKERVKGKLVIKEFPNGSASAANFRYVINEMKLKKGFYPDIVYVDYLQICASSRLKQSAVNSYEYQKSIAIELRALGQEFGIPIFSALQTNRSGLDSSDIGMGDTSDSIGVPFSADLMLAGMQPPEFLERNQYLIKQLKNRYNDLNYYNKFVIGVDKSRMKLYDVEETAQEGLVDTAPVMDTAERFASKKKSFEGFS